MADLPEARLAYQAPVFHHVGVDYFGLISVKHVRRTEKQYGVLFTCITTRAIHIEIAHSLEADAYIMSMRRMIASLGVPAHIWSDNERNFIGAEKEFRDAIQVWNKERIADASRKMVSSGISTPMIYFN